MLLMIAYSPSLVNKAIILHLGQNASNLPIIYRMLECTLNDPMSKQQIYSTLHSLCGENSNMAALILEIAWFQVLGY